MNICKKKSNENFKSFFPEQIPECKRSEAGIRPSSIKKLPTRSQRENIKGCIMIERYLCDNTSASRRPCSRPNNFMIKNRKYLNVPFEIQTKQPNVAYFSFLPESSEEIVTNSVKSDRRCKSTYRYARDSKYLQQLVQPKIPVIQSEAAPDRKPLLRRLMNQKENKLIHSKLPESFTPNKWTEIFDESNDEEESPLRDYSNILKPKFKK